MTASQGPDFINRLNDQGFFVFPTHNQEWLHNKKKLLETNHQAPIAKLVSISTGPHARTCPSDKAGGLQPVLYLCRNAKVTLTMNLSVPFGLYNGASGTVVDIIYNNGKRPPDSLPDVVMVMFPKYTGPAFISSQPQIIPIVPIDRRLDCPCRYCKRKQIPLRLGWLELYIAAKVSQLGLVKPTDI